MSFLGDFPLAATIDFHFTTRRFTTGAPHTLAGTPVISAYEDNGTTEITAGITLTADFDARTGLNHVRVVATGANGFEAGKSYSLVITTGTVDSVSVVGEVVGYFTLERSACFGRLGAPAGASVSADVAAVKVDTAAILVDTGTTLDGRIPAALVGGRMDASVGAVAANAITAASLAADAGAEIADAVWDEDATGHQTLGTFGQAIGDPVADTTTIYQSVVTDAAGANIAADIIAIEAQTDDIGAAGAGLTAVPWNASWDAEVQSEVDDALLARNLDKLVIVSGTADSGSTTTMVDAARTEADADYWKGRLILFTSGNISGQVAIIEDFNAGTDTFTFKPALTQAVATQTYVILPGLSVWDETLAEHLASGTTGNALNAAGSAGDPWGTALPGAYGAGTAGKIVGDNVNATISSRASQASVDTVDDFLDTEVAAIKAVTDALPNAGALTTIQADLDNIQTRLPTALVGGRMDSDVAVIQSAASVSLRSLASGTSDSGTTTTMVDAARTEADTDYWKGNLIVFTSGTIAGQVRAITGFNPTTDTVSFEPATTATVGTQTYEIWAAGDFLRPTTTGRTLDVSAGGEAGLDWANIGSPTTVQGLSGTTVKTATDVETDTQDLQSRTPAALVGGRTDSSVGAMAANTLTASALAADAVTEMQAGLSTLDAAGVRTAVGLATANLDTQLAAIQADLPQRFTKNVALNNFPFFMVDATDHVTGETGLTITATRSIDGAAFAACANAATEVANGIYKINLAASDMNGDTITLKFTATGADTRFITIITQPT